MKNALAFAFVALVLTACAVYPYHRAALAPIYNTPDFGGEQWRERVTRF